MTRINDDNFEDFVSNWDLFRGRLIIFLGAGASVGARNKAGQPLPNAYELRNHLWTDFKFNDQSRPFDPAELKLMTLEHASAIIEAKIGRTPLSEYLQRTFECDRPLWQHLVLPFLEPKALFTTNYDELVELGFARSNSALVDIICDARDPVAGRQILYKPHGSLTHSNQEIGKGGLVITQFDYLEMISSYRQMLARAMTGFNEACVLIVGYSFGDMDIGAELYSLRKKGAGIPWYAIFPRNDPQVRKMYSKRYGIEQIDSTFEDFIAELDQRKNLLPSHLKISEKTNLQTLGIIQ